jgi:hypothetical protein
VSDSSQNHFGQEKLLQEIQNWQKSFYDDVHDLFARGDENRGNIAFENWDRRFQKFLEKQLPNKKPDYISQTKTPNTILLTGTTILDDFTQRKGAMVRAFIDQLIDDAQKGYFDDEIIKNMPKDVNMSFVKPDNLKIFISHSKSDVQLATLVVELLRSALNLPAKDIRCTSVDGHRLPGGAEIDSQLRREIMGAKTVIGIISKESFDSAYVLFELGARWGQGENLIPLLAHGMHPPLKGPIQNYNALSCESETQLFQFIADVGTQIGVTPESANVFNAKIKAIVDHKEEHDSSFWTR